MKENPVLFFALLFVLLVVVSISVTAEVSVGVKQGDWIEYNVTYTGTPDPMHSISWARMEITSVQGPQIELAISTRFSNGTMLPETSTLNLATGHLGDDFIIPANLNGGDAFFDKYLGNVTINGVEQRTYAGATRTVVSGNTPQTLFYWDRTTGILVEGISIEPTYNLTSMVSVTNMWNPASPSSSPRILGLDPVVFFAIIVVLVVIVAVVAITLIRRKK